MSTTDWRRRVLRGALVLLALCAVVAFFLANAHQHFDLQTLQRSRRWLLGQQAVHPWRMALGFLGLLIGVVAFSLPALTLLTLAAGAIFGLLEGTVLVSFGSAIGATVVMLATRFVFRDAVRRRFAHRLQRVDAGIERDGAFYLLSIRLVPVFPFLLVNLLMGLTHIPVRTFYWATQAGMLVGVAVYVNAGTRIGHVQSLEQLISIPMAVALALLVVLPWASRWMIRRIRRWRHALRWRRRSR